MHSAVALISADVADEGISQGIAGVAETFAMLGLRQVTMAAGACLGLSLGGIDKAGAEAVSSIAKKAAIASHAEDHANKAEALAWYGANRGRYRSVSAAANAFMEKKLFPVKFRAVYGWMLGMNKSMPN